jgi:2-oxoglutarate ferredoxin oxidoreductase subunit gamma
MSQVLTTRNTKIHHELIIAGFGGQGVLKLGLVLAEAAMHEGREVVWTPAYGPETRGGPSFCTVIISSERIGAPIVALADTAIIMDQTSLPKYQAMVRPQGIVLINSSLVSADTVRTDIPAYAIAANAIAEELGNSHVSNMVVLGAFIKLTQLVAPETVVDSLREALPERALHLLPLNAKALEIGAERVALIAH